MATETNASVTVIEPESMDDATRAAILLRDHQPVILNFEETEAELAHQIIDFMSGEIFVLDGEIKKAGRNLFLLMPSQANLAVEE